MARFDGIYVFGYNSVGCEPIWMRFVALGVHCLPVVMADFVRDPRSTESEVNFLLGK